MSATRQRLAAIAGAALLALCVIGVGPQPSSVELARADCVAAEYSTVLRGSKINRHGKKRVKRQTTAGRRVACGSSSLEPPDPTPPDRLQVKARDTTQWTFLLSRPNVNSGDVKIELVNEGEDDHNLHLQQGMTPPEFVIPDVGPEGRSTMTFPLTAGTWHLWCSLPGHESSGMSANLTVDP